MPLKLSNNPAPSISVVDISSRSCQKSKIVSNSLADMETSDEHINLMRGWPSPDVLPATLLSNACQRVLLNPAEYTPILQYAPSAGHPALRQELSRLLASFYDVDPDTDRICVTGGASQSLACILQSFTDPNYTKAVWVIAPCYYLACGVFEDAGFAGRLRASPEDDEGVDLEALELKIQRLEQEDGDDGRAKPKASLQLLLGVTYCEST